MLNENKGVKKYNSIDPYRGQTPVKDILDLHYNEIENEEIRIQDYSDFDYEKFRDKRQETPEIPSITTTVKEPENEPEPENNPTDADAVEVKEHFLVPLYAITAFFAAMLIIAPLLVRKGPNRGIVQSSIMISAFCMWIFWFTIYFGQMHPLMGPRLENTTVAWIAYKLGNPIGNYTP